MPCKVDGRVQYKNRKWDVETFSGGRCQLMADNGDTEKYADCDECVIVDERLIAAAQTLANSEETEYKIDDIVKIVVKGKIVKKHASSGNYKIQLIDEEGDFSDSSKKLSSVELRHLQTDE